MSLPPGDYVRIRVADTGMGMDEATRAKATEPFFTTKSRRLGTGLGLSVVHGIAAQSSGVLRIKSAPNMGTTVDLWLPKSGTGTISAARKADDLRASPGANAL
jgi:signal transduction histidine kinase